MFTNPDPPGDPDGVEATPVVHHLEGRDRVRLPLDGDRRRLAGVLRTFCSASSTQKYTAASISCGYRPTPSRRPTTGSARPCAPGPRAPRPAPCPRGAAGRSRGQVAEVLERGLRLAPRSRQQLARPSPGRGRATCASRAFTASATSCCWAPSWMLRSRRRRSSSCAATIRWREARSSSTSRTFRRNSPPARRQVLGQLLLRRGHRIGRGHRTESAPRTSPWSRTSTTVSLDRGVRLGAVHPGARPSLAAGHASGTSSPATRSQTSATGARDLPRTWRHPRQDVLGRVRVADPLGELREDLVRRRATPVHEAVGRGGRTHPPGGTRSPAPARCRKRRRPLSGPDERPDADDDRAVDGDRQDHRAVPATSVFLTTTSSLVQAVLEDRDRRSRRARNDERRAGASESPSVRLPMPSGGQHLEEVTTRQRRATRATT